MNQTEYESHVWEIATLIRLVSGMDVNRVGRTIGALRCRYNVCDLDDVPDLEDNEIYEEYCKESDEK